MRRELGLCFFCLLSLPIITIFTGCTSVPAKKAAVAIPDLTKVLPADMKKVHHLGPTGLQGCMHVDMRWLAPGDLTAAPITERTRQIYVSNVAKGSPADGIVQVGDVILGIGEKPFERDPRKALADAINEAEKKENAGSLKLFVWRPSTPDVKDAKTRPFGTTRVVELKLKVLGTYSDTAPYNCEKSLAILEQTIRSMLPDPGKKDSKGRQVRMNGKLEMAYLALLATGDKKHFEIVKAHVLNVASTTREPSKEAVEKTHGWNAGYRLILLCEYYLLTKDKTVLPAIKNAAVTLSMGQSICGAWGHRMANPSYHNNGGKLHARLGGYAALNQPSLTCFMGLVLSRKCGVEHPELTAAIEKADVYFRHHMGRGAIPYGYGSPKEFLQTNNGTSGTAALAFALKGDKEAARFFSRMCAGAHTKHEVGHTGPFFNPLWTGMGANLAGPETYSEFFKRWTWVRTLTRKWDGGFAYQSPGGGNNNYRGLNSDAAMVLHFALPRRKLVITGRDQDESLWLKGKDAEAAADVWSIDYKAATDEVLLGMLDDDIPMIRGFAAMELARRGEGSIDALRKLLKGSVNQKIGACNALAGMKEKAAPALADLMELLRSEDEDFWVRSKAARAISSTGEAGLVHAPELLKILVKARPEDPLRDLERYLAPYAAQMVRHASFDYAANKDAIYPAALRLMKHPHVTARRFGMAMIENMTLEDFHIVADTIVKVIRNTDPTYTAYSGDRPRQMGLAILDRLNIEDGIPLAIDTIEVGIWGLSGRLNKDRGRLAQLKKYGANVKPYLPKLKEALKGQKEEEFKEIESLTETRKLIPLEEAKKAGRKK